MIHVSDELHRVVKGYCDGHGIKMTTWVDRVLRLGMREGVMPVPRRELVSCSYNGDHEERILNSRPFWADRPLSGGDKAR